MKGLVKFLPENESNKTNCLYCFSWPLSALPAFLIHAGTRADLHGEDVRVGRDYDGLVGPRARIHRRIRHVEAMSASSGDVPIGDVSRCDVGAPPQGPLLHGDRR